MSSNFLNHDYGSEEEDDDFNPAPAADTDNEQDAKGGSDEEVNKPPGRQVNDDEDEDENEASRPAGRDDDDEEQNGSEEEAEGGGENLDDDDEDDDDEEAVTGRPKKRRRRGGLNAFFEEEAEVDEDDDADDLDEEDMVDGFVAETHPDDLAALPAGAENDDRRHRELDRRRELEASMDAEKQAQALKERYGRNRQAASDAVVVPKRLLLPSVDDPSIWGVRCKPGKEREVVFSLQKRIEERPPGSRKPCKVISAFERGGTMAGYVYVEARRQADVLDALEEMLNVYPRSKMVLVPVKEMPDLLRVQKSEELVPGGWVRIKRGKYQNDLGQIEEVETNGLEVTLRLVPRLEYGLNEDSNAPINGGDAKRKRPGGANNPIARPPQRLFSEAEAKKKHARYLTATSGLGGKSWNYFGDTYIDGFLIKDFKVQHLITKNVNPQLDEVTKFARGADDGTSNLDLAALAASLKNTAAEETFLPGDMVEVFGGEQQGVIGRTVSTRGDIVTLRVTEGELDGQTIDAPVKTLRKRFREGDHVKVIGGSRYRDELGMVVRIKDDRVTVLSDMSMQEITVFSKDLREAADSGTDGRLGRFDIHDLVQLDASTVACVVKVDRESMRVLDQNGSIRSILPSQVTNKILPRRNAVATDRSGAEIRHGDTVREIYGEQKVGVVLHIHRSFLFLHNKTQVEDSGVFVVRTTNVTTVSAKGGRTTGASSGPDLSKMNPALLKGGANGGAMPPPPKTFGRDRLIGKTISVRKGPYKGYIGIVKDSTDTIARVELHTKNKIVTVPKEFLVAKDPITGQTLDMSRFGGGRPQSGGRAPFGGSAAAPRTHDAWQGGRTPMASADFSRTPAWGGSSSRTPAWSGAMGSGGGGGGGRTPAWKADGSRTAYGGAAGYSGGRTPAWNSGARTPYGSGSGSGDSGFDAFAAGSRTPAHGGGSRTPAWGPGSTAASNPSSHRPYDAPTPGGEYSAPTPGEYGDAATPAASAPTPRAWNDSAPTPGAANAPTPGAFGGGQRFPGAYDAPTPAAGSGKPYDAPTPAIGMGMPATPAAAAFDGFGDNDGDDGGPRYEEGTPSP